MSSLTAHTLWRSLEQAAQDPDFLARAGQEFPGVSIALGEPLDRREAMKLVGAMLLWSGLAGCDSKFGKPLIPAVVAPPGIVPARPNFFATARVLDGYATGILVKQVMGRPLKVEGNPLHPASLGATDAFAQALPLDFYDPDRAAGLTARGAPSDRLSLEREINAWRTTQDRTGGRGLRILLGSTSSPTLTAQLQGLFSKYPEARLTFWEPLNRSAVDQGAIQIYGRALETIPHLDRIDILFAVESDLLSAAPACLRHARDFAARRNPAQGARMSRIYALESTPTLVGSIADHRLIASPADIARIVGALAQVLGSQGPQPSDLPAWFAPLVDDLERARGRAFVHVGREQPAELHALAHLVNEVLQGRNSTFDLIDPIRTMLPEHTQALDELTQDMRDGRVSSLVILDSNPVYAAPAPLGFAEALQRVPWSLAVSSRADETARAATWFVPLAHPWECWSDARAFDGTLTILQPQALPLYRGLSAHELIDRLLVDTPGTSEGIVRAYWQSCWGAMFEERWREALAAGIVAGSAATPVEARPRDDGFKSAPAPTGLRVNSSDSGSLDLLFRPDPSLWDGRFANNPWLQELPRPLTKLVWDNPLLVSPALAKRLALENGDQIRLKVGDTALTTPIWILPGQAPESLTALLGSGRGAGGRLASAGIDFYPLVGASGAVHLEKVPGRHELACTEHHNLLLDTPAEILKHATLEDYTQNPRFAADPSSAPALYRRPPPGPAAWGMSIDLNACVGCNACIVACQAENNIPVVGKAQVLKEREMQWLRIDRYYEGSAEAPTSFFQPVLCMHCEEAPCENVCPVGATVHDSEGLNVMVYNRCIGTRFCSNNCPYKVRRFNFFAFAREQARPPESWNPEVTVRARGVMEKCSYCVQRIAEARIEADRENRPVGEVRTACQSACPTQAFTFGNLADETSAVVQRKRSPLSFAMLESQATHPRTTYEALVRNPNPALKGGAS